MNKKQIAIAAAASVLALLAGVLVGKNLEKCAAVKADVPVIEVPAAPAAPAPAPEKKK